MGFHLAAYAGSALDASAGDVQVNAVAEQLLLINANRFRMPSNMKIQFAYAGGVGLTRARIVSPHFRVPNLPQIVPVNAALVVPTNYGIMDFRENPLQVFNNEEIELQGTNGAANTVIGFLGLTDGDLDQTIPRLDLRWARFTATPTSVALGWSARGEITFQDTLESGIYGVYGLQVSGTTHLAARLIFNNQYLRPGSIGFASSDLVPHKIFTGGMGEWGRFENSTPPGIEVFNSAAGVAAFNGLMLIQLLQRQ